MSTNQILFDRNKARPVTTVLGKPKLEFKEVKSEISTQTNSMDSQNQKPKIEIEQFLNPERRSSRTQSQTSHRRSSKPKIEIEQFLNPERRSSRTQSQSSDRIRRSSKPKIEIEQFLNPERKTGRSQSPQINQSEFTAQNYHQMPDIYRRTHPLAPGGGIRTPFEFGAPPPPEYYHQRRPQSTQMQGSVRRSPLVQRRGLYTQNRVNFSSRGLRTGQTDFRQRTLPAFRRRLSPTRSQGQQNRLYLISHHRRSASNRGIGQNTPFASVDYSQMPEWFQRRHPQAPGGGLYAPPRSYAPQVSPENNWFASQ